MRSEPVSKALFAVSVSDFPPSPVQGCDIQLHAKGSGENGTEEGDVTPDDGAALDCQ